MVLPSENNPPPFPGTVFNFPLAIDSNTATNFFKKAEYLGFLFRTWWDYREIPDGLQSRKTHVYLISTNDGTEFEMLINSHDFQDADDTNSTGYKKMIQHANAIAMVPFVFRQWLKRFALNGRGAGSRAGASPTLRTMNVNTGYTDHLFESGDIEELFLHEGCHGAVDLMFKYDARWLKAQHDDNRFISKYAEENPEREDLAETMPAWIYARKHLDILKNDSDAHIDISAVTDAKVINVVKSIPNRLRFLENNFVGYLDGSIYKLKSQRFKLKPATKSDSCFTPDYSWKWGPSISLKNCEISNFDQLFQLTEDGELKNIETFKKYKETCANGFCHDELCVGQWGSCVDTRYSANMYKCIQNGDVADPQNDQVFDVLIGRGKFEGKFGFKVRGCDDWKDVCLGTDHGLIGYRNCDNDSPSIWFQVEFEGVHELKSRRFKLKPASKNEMCFTPDYSWKWGPSISLQKCNARNLDQFFQLTEDGELKNVETFEAYKDLCANGFCHDELCVGQWESCVGARYSANMYQCIQNGDVTNAQKDQVFNVLVGRGKFEGKFGFKVKGCDDWKDVCLGTDHGLIGYRDCQENSPSIWFQVELEKI